MTLKTPKMIFHFPLMALALFTSTGLASATTCDRACLIEQAKQFNANMLAHTVEKIPLAANANIREKDPVTDCAFFELARLRHAFMLRAAISALSVMTVPHLLRRALRWRTE